MGEEHGFRLDVVDDVRAVHAGALELGQHPLGVGQAEFLEGAIEIGRAHV